MRAFNLAHMIARVLICVIWVALGAQAAPLLSVDFDCRSNNPTATFPGFASFLITSNASAISPQTNGTMRSFGALRLTLTGNGINRGYTDRAHALPTNQGAFTESLLLRDSVYSPDSSTTGGLNLLIENLTPASRLKVTIWSFDALHAPIRASDWYANGILVRSNYQFNNAIMPTRNDDYRFSFKCTVDAAGQLMIRGRRNPSSTNAFGAVNAAVYLNALQIEPEPLEIIGVGVVGTELRLTFVVRPQPGTYAVEETTGGQWQPTGGVVYGPATDNLVTARFPRPSRQTFYRIRYNY